MSVLFGRQDEDRLGEVHLLRELLHQLLVDVPPVGEHGELVAGERLVGEDVGDDVAKGRPYPRVYVRARNSDAPRSSYSRGPDPVVRVPGVSGRPVRLVAA